MIVPFFGYSQIIAKEKNKDIKVGNSIGQSIITNHEPQEMQRQRNFNLEELKVRWKKAALENCPGVPCITTPSFICGTSTISDIDGNTYNTVLIGTQCWTKENLKVTRYNDNTSIPLDATGGSTGGPVGEFWSTRMTGAYTIYANEASSGSNASNYGFLYNWYAAAGIITAGGSPTKNICPDGWHIPTDAEWTTLTNYLGGESIAGGKMKTVGTAYWNTPNTAATNESDFSGLPGGKRSALGGDYSDVRNYASFWSSTHIDLNNAWDRGLFISLNSILRGNNTLKACGSSVRCLGD